MPPVSSAAPHFTNSRPATISGAGAIPSPARFTANVLGLSLYPWQIAVLDWYRLPRERVLGALTTPNGAGKTSCIVGGLAFWWLNAHPTGRVVITTKDGKQLRQQLLPAFERFRPRFPSWSWSNSGFTEIRNPSGGRIVAFTTNHAGRAEGWHKGADDRSPLLVIVDEAKSVDEEIFHAIDRCTFNSLLYVSSPGLMLGTFFNAFTRDAALFQRCQVGARDCPHIPPDRIAGIIAKYGPEHPLTRSTIDGEFMDQDGVSSFVFPLRLLQRVITHGAPPPRGRDRSAFCDFAAGGDENVLAIREGAHVRVVAAWRDPDTVAAATRFIREFQNARLVADEIFADEGGLGRPMVDHLGALGWHINRVNFGTKAYDPVYENRGSEMWHATAEKAAEVRTAAGPNGASPSPSPKARSRSPTTISSSPSSAPAKRKSPAAGASASKARTTSNAAAAPLPTAPMPSAAPGPAAPPSRSSTPFNPNRARAPTRNLFPQSLSLPSYFTPLARSVTSTLIARTLGPREGSSCGQPENIGSPPAEIRGTRSNSAERQITQNPCATADRMHTSSPSSNEPMSPSNPPSLASALNAAGALFQIPAELLAGLPGAPLTGPIAPQPPTRNSELEAPSNDGQPDEQAAEVLTVGRVERGEQTRNPLRSEDRRSHADAGETPPTRCPDLETASSSAPPRRRRDAWTPFLARTGRPAIFTPELVTEISDSIQRYGMSDTTAGRNAGVSSSTISRWKQEMPQFVEFLAEARDAFENEHLHRIEVFKRKDGQCDPHCSRWLLQKGIPEKYGPVSTRRNATERETRNSKLELPSKKPKPGTPEFWATVEEEPLPRENLPTCLMTPGRVKFFSTVHLVSMPYRPSIDRNAPPVIPTPEETEAELESFFLLQDDYFSLPKEERLPYLHATFEREFGKVLSPEKRAATDALITDSPSPSSSSSASSPAAPASSPSCPNPSTPPSNPVPGFPKNEDTTPGENVQNIPESRPTAEPGAPTSAPASSSPASATAPAAPVSRQSSPNPENAAVTPAPKTSTAAPQKQPPLPPAPPKRPLFTVKRRAISPSNPAWAQYQADLRREAMEAKLAEMEELQAQGKPVDSTHEAGLALYHELARQAQERQKRENDAFFNRPDEEEEITDCF